MNVFFKTTFVLAKPKLPIKRVSITIKRDKEDDLLCYHYYQEGSKGLPLLIYFHGGGFQMEGTFIHQNILERFVLESNVQVLYVKYRLMPEFTFPKPFEDAMDAYRYVLNHKKIFQTDLIYTGGDSAGGHIAYALSLYDLKQEHSYIKKTLLLYPVLTNQHVFASHKMYTDTPMWNQVLNKTMWNRYLKHAKDLTYVDLLQHDPKGMSSVYIETAQFDPLRDEGIALEKRLIEACVDTLAIHTKYTVHGYDALPNADITKKMMMSRIAFLKEDL
jgi:acetyl esterase/lipase